MNTRKMAIALGLGLLLVQAGRGDTLILNSGERIEGEIAGQTDTEISFRRAFGNGNIKYVSTYKRSEVARIESGTLPAAPQVIAPPPPPSSQPETEAHPLPPIEDKAAFLKGTLKKWQDGNTATAGMDISRLIGASSPQELEEYSKVVEAELKMPLAEWAAQAHWKAATEKGKAHAIHIMYVTTYELPALVPIVNKEYEAALKENVKAKAAEPRNGTKRKVETEPKPAAEAASSAPADKDDPNALSIARYIDKPSEFDAPRAEAVAYLGQVQYTMSLLNERVRLDPEVKKDKTLRTSLNTKRMQLSQLMRAVAVKVSGARAGQPSAAAPVAQPAARPQPQPRAAQPQKTNERVPLKQGLQNQLNQHQADQLQEGK